MEVLTTSQLAQQANVNIATIRFYERERLLEEPPRKESGYRQYSPEAVQRIRFIKHAQELGFSLKEVRELLALKIDGSSRCSDVKARAEAKIGDIEQKLETLGRLRHILNGLVLACGDGTTTSECPILEALDTDGLWEGDEDVR